MLVDAGRPALVVAAGDDERRKPTEERRATQDVEIAAETGGGQSLDGSTWYW